MNLFFILVLSSLIENIAAESSGKCGSWINIIDCNIQKELRLSRTRPNSFHAYYKRGDLCPEGTLHFDWQLVVNISTKGSTIFNFPNSTQRETFVLESYEVGTGYHAIAIYAKIDNIDDASSSCNFQIIPETPIPFIEGGTERTVEKNYDFQVDGRNSINRDVPSGTKGLQFKWTCKQLVQNNDNFCEKPIRNDPYIVVPSKYATVDQIFDFELKVKTDHVDIDWQTTKQKIYVKENPTILRIRCLKNCPPQVEKTNSKERSILKVNCLKNCKGLTSYNWTVDKPNFNYDTNTEGTEADTFVIKENVLKPGETYNIAVVLKGTSGTTSEKINVYVPPTLKSCRINPNKGTAFITKFTIDCEFSGEGSYTFEIYSLDENTETLMTVGNYLSVMKFVLGPTSKVKVNMVDGFQFSDFKIIDVSVDPGINTTVTEEELNIAIKSLFYDKNSEDSLDNLSSMKRYVQLLQGINSVTDVINTVPPDKIKEMKEFQIQNLKLLQNVSVDSIGSAEQVVSIAGKIANQQADSPDPDIARLATDLCKINTQKYNSLVKHEKYPASFFERTKPMAKASAGCAQASAKPNKAFFKDYASLFSETESNITSDIADVQVITENYPDYVDESDPTFKNTIEKIENYEKSTENLIALCYSISKTLSLTMVPEEPTKYAQKNFFQVTATKIKGSDTPPTAIISQNVVLVPSRDLESYNEEITIEICTSKVNPFWWTVNQPAIITNIALLRFETEEEILKNFRSPFSINFEFHEEFKPNVSHEGITPRISNVTGSKEEDEFERIVIFKIDVLSKRGFSVEFINLNEDCSLEVFVTHFEKVSTAEFHRKATVITNTSNLLYTEHNLDYDSWYYLYVLPDKKMGNSQVTFQFSVYSFSCVQWIHTNRSWTFACQATPKSSRSSIECLCYHSSVLMGHISYNQVSEEKTLIMENILNIRVNYTIFLSVVGVFLIYCILLSYFSSSNKIQEQPVYFLGDVPRTYRYGYLVIVKTGDKRNAGTTSNVIIKIYGNKSVSKEHLLNYPDPEKRILQKNGEDWFILGTPEYLGDIEQLEMMFDSIGPRPSWHCSEIEIIDLQENNYWLFLIDFQFEISIKENYFYTAVPVNKDDAKKKEMINEWCKKIKNSFHGQHMWNIIMYEDPYIPKPQRLTIMLSIFLTTYVVTLFLYGCPNLINSDILEPYIEFSFYPKVFLISFIGLIITFVIHYPLVFYLKLWRRQQNRNCIIIGWCFIATLIIVSMTILIIFGFWLPYFTSLLWLTSVIITLLVYIFLLENFTHSLNRLTLTKPQRVDYIFQKLGKIIKYIEIQRNTLYRNFGSSALRPYFSHLYTPMEESVIKEKKQSAIIKSQVIEILEDLIMISIYVLILYILVLSDRHPMTYLNHYEVQELIKGTHLRTIKFETITNIQEINLYLTKMLIPSLQSTHWYGKYVHKDPGMTIDNSNKYIGVARLRQHRSHNITCVIPKFMNFLNMSCKPEFNIGAEYKNFSEEWKPESNRSSRMSYVWTYQTAYETSALPYSGKFAIYPGGGYIALLGRTLKNSITNVNYLDRTLWLDLLTRCIFIEFLLYSPNSNLFNSVRVRFEINPTGYVIQSFDVHTAQLIIIEEENFLKGIIASFVMILACLVLKIIYKVSREKRIYFKDAMRILDIILIILSIIYLILYMNRTRLVKEFLDKLQVAKHNEFISYFHLFYVETVFKLLAAFLVFLATLRLWKLLRFLVIIKIFEKTITLLIAPLLCVLFYQFSITISFAIAWTTLFGDKSMDFETVCNSFTTLMMLSLGLINFNFKLFGSNIYFIYYSFYMIFVLLIYNFYVTIITISYGEAQRYYSNNVEYTVIDYLKEQYWYFSTILKIKFRKKRMRAGEHDYEEKIPVSPKREEHRYAGCLTTPSSRMKTMALISLCVLQNAKDSSRKTVDKELIKKLIINMFVQDSDNKEIFYLNNDGKNKKPFVDDLTFVKMEKIVNMLCGEDWKQNTERLDEMYRKINNNQTDRIERIGQDLKVLLNIVDNIKLQ